MHNRYLSAVLDVSAVLGVLAIGAFLTSSAYGETAMEKSLYDRLGGYEPSRRSWTISPESCSMIPSSAHVSSA